MKTITVARGPQEAAAIILGCMRMPALSVSEAATIIQTALDCGVNFFDNATAYGNGEAETRFGQAFAQSGNKRDDVFIQSKVGLCFERNEFDWTKENILSSVDDSLHRMKLDYLDSVLLHRPDLIFEPEQVAEAFDTLEKSGKVRYFGVSNVPPMQLELLKKYVKQPLIFNQLQLSLEQSQLIDQSLYLNNKTTDMSIDRDNGILDYCRLHDITIQAWSPLQYGMFEGSFIDHPNFPELNQALQEIGDKYGISKAAAAIAWILRHPANMQAIVGTMNPEHLADVCTAANVKLTHHEWYHLYLAAGKYLP
ncbi:aldo/keto reductase [Streptococcus pantholopis]|uniref:Aldo/keto reductase n=1 Tax=Streptococcus pantholopis TaxID=1811193 RepID=A0A172Q6J4_9STRE|nr:aldo/keto reductase [Streptococcus pantholopis]AND79123.1 aldo/keto reductase [Streptococcus pantholopis]